MPTKSHFENVPQRSHFGVMVSSTYTDLKDLRRVLIDAAASANLFPKAMEHSAALATDLIDSSLSMVRSEAAYVLLIGHRYGQQPVCADNPAQLSITELEFNEALDLKRPMLVFILGEDYLLAAKHFDRDSASKAKLDAFRARAISLDGSGAGLGRVCAIVNTPEEFGRVAERSMQRLAQQLDEAGGGTQPAPEPTASSKRAGLPPCPPALHSVPAYIGSHTFVGRHAELDQLDDWSAAEDAHPVLLFDAIGGSGKSMLTWHWFGTRAPQRRGDWRGRFWYSFYEAGSSMAECCRQALAYMCHRPLDDFKDHSRTALAADLLRQLRVEPWLLVLDGLERVLVAYNRSDAATIADEALNQPTDQIAERNPCAAARSEDDDLLRQLAAAAPSKILVTTRLVPQALLNAAHQAIPGVRREPLRGLRPEDAVLLLQSTGVRGQTVAMQRYLQAHCDGHPLVIGALAGLMADFVPVPGNFDAWEPHADGGAALDLAALDLVQKRNHILRAAIDAVPTSGRDLLATLALVHGGVDAGAIQALNPHRPSEPDEVEEPEEPERSFMWKHLDENQKDERRKQHEQQQVERTEYLKAHAAWLASPELKAAPARLSATLRDLRRRGLVQVGEGSQVHYDLHPVVRGIVSGALADGETERLGQRVVDHFSNRAHNPYEQADSLHDLAGGFHVVRVLLRMGRFGQAFQAWRGDLSHAALFNVQANAEMLALLKPFFPQGWLQPSPGLDNRDSSFLMNEVAMVLESTGLYDQAIQIHGATLPLEALGRHAKDLHAGLANLAKALRSANRIADASTCRQLQLRAAQASEEDEALFRARLDAFADTSMQGQWKLAEAHWASLDGMGRSWSREVYRPGHAEFTRACNLWWQGLAPQTAMDAAETLARSAKNRAVIRETLELRGEWRLTTGDASAAITAFDESVQLARASGQPDLYAEAWLSLARQQAGQLTDPLAEANRLHDAGAKRWPMAKLWQAAGEPARAREEARSDYLWAWADGEPYIRHFELARARALLTELGEPIPDLPKYDPTRHPRFSWQDEVEAALTAIEADNAERAAEEEKKGEKKGSEAS